MTPAPVRMPRALHAHQPPQPPRPQPPGFDPDLANVRPIAPMVYVEPAFEYRQLTRQLQAGESLPTAAELDALGRDGWELVSVIQAGQSAHFYFKRVAR